VILAAGVALTFATAGCGDDDSSSGGDQASSEPTKITVGTLPIANAAPMYLGMRRASSRTRASRSSHTSARAARR
jgi:hypothetical protein